MDQIQQEDTNIVCRNVICSSIYVKNTQVILLINDIFPNYYVYCEQFSKDSIMLLMVISKENSEYCIAK